MIYKCVRGGATLAEARAAGVGYFRGIFFLPFTLCSVVFLRCRYVVIYYYISCVPTARLTRARRRPDGRKSDALETHQTRLNTCVYPYY